MPNLEPAKAATRRGPSDFLRVSLALLALPTEIGVIFGLPHTPLWNCGNPASDPNCRNGLSLILYGALIWCLLYSVLLVVMLVKGHHQTPPPGKFASALVEIALALLGLQLVFIGGPALWALLNP